MCARDRREPNYTRDRRERRENQLPQCHSASFKKGAWCFVLNRVSNADEERSIRPERSKRRFARKGYLGRPLCDNFDRGSRNMDLQHV